MRVLLFFLPTFVSVFDADTFDVDMFLEMAKYGEVEEIFVCRNLGDHLVGNVYVKVRSPRWCSLGCSVNSFILVF